MKDQTESGDGWERGGEREVHERGNVFIRIADSLFVQQKLTQQCKATILH